MMTNFDGGAQPSMRTSIGFSTEDQIRVRGYNLSEELMGEVDFGSMFFLLVSGRVPNQGEARLFNAVLVALADHGLTPTALAARLTYTGAPDAIQGAIASGVLGAGSVFLGSFEDVGRILQEAEPNSDASDDELRELAKEIVAALRRGNLKVPGLGHPIHKKGDPRTARLLNMAEELDLLGPRTRLMLHLRQEASEATGRDLVLNATGACGALLSDLGFDASILRGIAVVSRAAGLVGHLQEESEQPMGQAIWQLVERESTYEDPRRAEPT
jgi:citrate synthase